MVAHIRPWPGNELLGSGRLVIIRVTVLPTCMLLLRVWLTVSMVRLLTSNAVGVVVLVLLLDVLLTISITLLCGGPLMMFRCTALITL